MKRIPVAGPWITEREVQYVAEAAREAWYENAGKYTHRFEQEFARYLGVRFAVSVPSCTAAIHLSMAALGVGPGDEVIVPEATWIASAAPISYLCAEPVFADIDSRTWCLSAESFERSITPRTKAVVTVDLYGGMPEMTAIQEIAKRRGIAVIEDAAQAFGSEYNGRRAGSFGDTGVFSFHGTKTLTTGEGGMLVTDREDIYQRVLVLRDHGRQPGDRTFFNSEVAYKYCMSSLQAALGLAQLERADELIARKREIFSWYLEDLDNLQQLQLNAEPDGVRNSFWMVTAIFDPRLGIRKERVIESLREFYIDSRPFFHPLSSLPAYAGTAASRQGITNNPIAYQLCPYGVNLPSAMNLERDDVRRVANAVRSLL